MMKKKILEIVLSVWKNLLIQKQEKVKNKIMKRNLIVKYLLKKYFISSVFSKKLILKIHCLYVNSSSWKYKLNIKGVVTIKKINIPKI